MPRKSSKEARYDRLTQHQQRKVDKRKKFSKKKDRKDWTDAVFAKLKKEQVDENNDHLQSD
jgi:hypothetical protein